MGNPFGVTVQLERFAAGSVVDGFAQPATYAAPVDVPGCAVAPGAPVDLPVQQGRNGERVDCTVYVPADSVPSPAPKFRDRMTVPRHGLVDVLDSPADWGVNPLTGKTSGLVVICGRFDG
jgi:hypothetical protein